MPIAAPAPNLETLAEDLAVAAKRYADANGRDPKELLVEVSTAFPHLTQDQKEWLASSVRQFLRDHKFWRLPASDLINEKVLQGLGDGLRLHHALSRHPISKDKFEFAFETALRRGGFSATVEKSRTNPGRDLVIDGVPVSLKTEAAGNIALESLHISKYMELGKGPWELEALREKFFVHMTKYDRIFQFRCHDKGPLLWSYELVEIPKSLLLEAANWPLVTQTQSKQNPQPGYCWVYEPGTQNLKFALYFDAGSERKLQIKHIAKSYCTVHATWQFESVTMHSDLPSLI